MEVNFLNQKPCIPLWPGVFQFDTFLSVVLRKLVCISAFGPSLCSSSSLLTWFIHLAFSLCFLFAIFLSRVVGFHLSLVVGMFYCHLLPSVDRIFFHSFGMSYFVCIILPFVDISSILLLLPALSGIFPQVVLLLFSVLSFLSCSYLFQRFSFVLSLLAVFVGVLSEFLVEIPILVLTFRDFWGDPTFFAN